MNTLKILILVTSHAELGATHKPTGLWLEELAVPYVTFSRAGAEVTIASPKGGPAPIDPKSLTSEDADVKAFQADAAAQQKVHATRRLAELDLGTYDAVFVAGGHGVMWDLTRPEVGAALSKAWQANRVLAAVCHGPAALANVVDAKGTPVVSGRQFAGFTNDEEKAVELTEVVPFLIESKLTSLGGHHQKAPMWQPKVVRDGKLVTGQNPASSRGVAQAVLEALRG